MAKNKLVRVTGHFIQVGDGMQVKPMKGKTGRLIEQYRDGAATVRIDGRIHHIPTCMLEVLSECGGVKRG